jgi:amino acid transporter
MQQESGVSTTTAAAHGVELRHNALGLGALVYQGITHISPATSVIFLLPLIALKAGPVMDISMVLSMIACFFIASTVAEFSRFMPSSGGYYSFVTRGLGDRAGFIATVSYLAYDCLGAAATLGFIGYIAGQFLIAEVNVHIAWWILALVAFLLVFVLTYRGVRLSLRTTIILGSLEMLVMIALAVNFLVHPGPHSSFVAPLKISLAPHGFRGVIAGMVFSILALSGFEAPAPLAQEANRPARFIRRAVLTSLLVVGIFYIFEAYASAIGWGTGAMAAFASNAAPYTLLAHRLWGPVSWLVFFAVCNSAVAVGMACTNAATRVMYTMGQAGTLPARFGHVHPKYRTPTFAIFAQIVGGMIVVAIIGGLFGGSNVFGFGGTIATLGVIVLYFMANIALISYMRRERPQEFRPVLHVVFPVLGSLALLPALFTTVWPVPAYPDNLTVYVYVAWILAGVVGLIWLTRRRPDALRRRETILVMKGATDAGGDDEPAEAAR